MKFLATRLKAAAVVASMTTMHASSYPDTVSSSSSRQRRLRGGREAGQASSSAGLLLGREENTAERRRSLATTGTGTSDDTNSLLSTTATSIFTSVAESAGSDVASTLVGWAFSALGISTGDGAALDEINNQLQEINNQLTDVVNDLNGIDQEIQELVDLVSKNDCQDALNNPSLTKSMTCITDNYETYGQLMNTVANTGTLDFCSDRSNAPLCALGWAQNVVMGSDYSDCNGMDIYTAASNVAGAMTGTNGVLSNCIPYIMEEYQDSMYTGFQEWELYKNKIYPFVDNFYTLQIQALEMYTEANHLLAWNVTGQPKLTDNSTAVVETLSQICNQTTWNNYTSTQKQQLSFYCTQPTQQYSNTLKYTQSLIEYAGLPFSTANETLLEIIDLNTSPQMYPRSLDVFNKMSASPGNCTYPLNSTHPCGNALVDVKDSESNYKNVVLSGGFSNWTALTDMGTFKRWFSSVYGSGDESASAKSRLESLGFQNITDQIIMGGNVGTPSVEVFYEGSTYCKDHNCVDYSNWLPVQGTMTGFVDVVLKVSQSPVVDPDDPADPDNGILQYSGSKQSMECNSNTGPSSPCAIYYFYNAQIMPYLRGEANDRNYFYNGGPDYSDDENLLVAGCSGNSLQSSWNGGSTNWGDGKGPPGFWSGSTTGNQYTMPYITIDWEDDAICDGSKYSWSPQKSYRVDGTVGNDDSRPNTRCGPAFDYMVDQFLPSTPVNEELLAMASTTVSP